MALRSHIFLCKLTELERYKSDTVCIELDRSNSGPRGGTVMRDIEELKREFTDDERRIQVDYYKLTDRNGSTAKSRIAGLKHVSARHGAIIA